MVAVPVKDGTQGQNGQKQKQKAPVKQEIKRKLYLQSFALVRKNFQIQRKQKRSNWCRCYCIGYCVLCGYFIMVFVPATLGLLGS